MTAKVTVHFTAAVNVDIHTELRCLAESGPFAIPIVCTTRKACVAIDTRGT
jgi:hypothetical protein